MEEVDKTKFLVLLIFINKKLSKRIDFLTLFPILSRDNFYGEIMMSVVAGIVVVTLAFTISMYNKLVMRRNQVSSVEASVDVQLKRRYDLLPNLVATAKEYMSHERSLLERIVTLRESAKSAHSTSEKFQLNNEISGLLRNLQVRLENYPDLKANQNLLQIQTTLSDVEEQISAARRTYNSAVEEYNNSVEMFPSNLIANLFNFQKGTFFDIPQNEAEVPNVGNLFKQ